jgi:hypothetical protein
VYRGICRIMGILHFLQCEAWMDMNCTLSQRIFRQVDWGPIRSECDAKNECTIELLRLCTESTTIQNAW